MAGARVIRKDALRELPLGDCIARLSRGEAGVSLVILRDLGDARPVLWNDFPRAEMPAQLRALANAVESELTAREVSE
ncbi:hypothetical protein [Thioclava sp. F36-6]|uniref:hypothetical protein n=1 Tax=Thioclava sp. F36-6 TaxID=1915316 RepID=UPI0009973DBD|nr:hypothetical protein [Thioclava sp. F36-6]OOY31598.1 hypothetical protein BMI88_10990 [Thioclava sp. F36-6]